MINLINSIYKNPPFSTPFDEDSVLKLGNDLLNLFNINGKSKLIYLHVDQAVHVERYFRFRWWVEKEDPLKYAMHNLGRQLDVVSGDNIHLKEKLTQAWQYADLLTNSEIWRGILQEKISYDVHSKTYFQIFFRIAQQSVNRAVRWETIFSETPSPYSYIYTLITHGVMPVGIFKETFYIIRIIDVNSSHKVSEYNFRNIEINFNITELKKVFISYEFSKYTILDKIIKELKELSVDVDLGPVPNNIIPIEHQLTDRIIKCSSLLVVLETVDKDFGLPIWIFQEIDLALFLNIPVMIFIMDDTDLKISDKLTVFKYSKDNININELMSNFKL